jgi:hypothetical protein
MQQSRGRRKSWEGKLARSIPPPWKNYIRLLLAVTSEEALMLFWASLLELIISVIWAICCRSSSFSFPRARIDLVGPATGAGARELDDTVPISATPAFAAFADARDDAVPRAFTADDGFAGARAAAVLLLLDMVESVLSVGEHRPWKFWLSPPRKKRHLLNSNWRTEPEPNLPRLTKVARTHPSRLSYQA